VHRARREVQEERPIGSALLLVAQVADGLVGEVLGEVVAVVGVAGRVDELVVAHEEVGGPLVGVGPEEAVVVLEPETGGPAVERPRRGHLPPGREVPLPDREGVVAGVAQQARDGGRGAREVGGVAGELHRHLGHEAHADRVVVAPGEQAGPGRRAEGGDVEPLVAQTARREPVDVGRGDVGPEAAQLCEAGVVEQDHQNVRSRRRRVGHERDAIADRKRLTRRSTGGRRRSRGGGWNGRRGSGRLRRGAAWSARPRPRGRPRSTSTGSGTPGPSRARR